MARLGRILLKTAFALGARPTQDDFWNVLDSYVHKDDLQAINVQQFNQRLSQFYVDLVALSGSGSIITLGDLFRFVQNVPGDWDLREKLLASGTPTWANIQNKPTSMPFRWQEQIISTDTDVINPTSSGNTLTKWVVSEVAAIGSQNRVMITDIQINRKLFGTSSTNYFFVDVVTRVKLAINPIVELPAVGL